MIQIQTRRLPFRAAALTLLLLFAAAAVTASAEQKSTGSSTNAVSAHNQGLVNVNTADIKTLETLPGVGPTIAQRIIEGRPYHKLSDLENVKGLSQAKLEGLKDKISFGHTTTAPGKGSHDSVTGTTEKHPSSTGNAPTASTSTRSSSEGHASANKLAPGEKININTASAEQLDRLPGIGKTKAHAIVDYRTKNGSFKTLEDIEKVKGIKGGSFEKLKDYIKLSD